MLAHAWLLLVLVMLNQLLLHFVWSTPGMTLILLLLESWRVGKYWKVVIRCICCSLPCMWHLHLDSVVALRTLWHTLPRWVETECGTMYLLSGTLPRQKNLLCKSVLKKKISNTWYLNSADLMCWCIVTLQWKYEITKLCLKQNFISNLS